MITKAYSISYSYYFIKSYFGSKSEFCIKYFNSITTWSDNIVMTSYFDLTSKQIFLPSILIKNYFKCLSKVQFYYLTHSLPSLSLLSLSIFLPSLPLLHTQHQQDYSYLHKKIILSHSTYSPTWIKSPWL